MGDLMLAITLAAILGAIVGAIQPSVFGKLFKRPTRLKAISSCLGLATVAFISFGISTDKQEPIAKADQASSAQPTPPALPATAVGATLSLRGTSDHSIVNRADGERDLIISIEIESAWNEASLVSAFGSRILGVMSDIKASQEGNFRATHFNLVTMVTDAYNNSSMKSVLGITLDNRKAEKFNYDGALYQMLLDVATTKVGGTAIGQKAVNDWCANASNHKFAPRFCTMAQR